MRHERDLKHENNHAPTTTSHKNSLVHNTHDV